MRRPSTCDAAWLALLLVASAGTAACTLSITEPYEPPAETWDPGVNTHPDGAGFQSLLDGYVREGLPGVVLYVRTPEGLWNGAAGYAKIETEEPMLPTNRHHAASVTKMYTAAAVMHLAEDGVIDLDARISAYLPEAVYGPIPNAGEATVRQLLGHTSGIPDFSGDLAYDLDFLNDPLGDYPVSRLLSYLHGQSAWSRPGEHYFYSNANYVLLALIMDEVTEGTHADVISQRILQPLGLTATYYKNEAGYPAPAGLVNSYEDLAGNGRLMNVTDMAIHNAELFMGNAGLIATSADYAAFLEALLDGRVVGQASLDQMMERPVTQYYGLGLSFRETPYGPGIGHDGGDFGARSEVRRFPDLDATLVLLMNAGDSGVPDRLFDDLWEEVMAAALGGL